jgi:hypothetical protein
VFTPCVGPSFETARSLSSGAHSRNPWAPAQDEDLMVKSAATPRVSNHVARLLR